MSQTTWLLGCTLKSFSLIDGPLETLIWCLRYFGQLLEEGFDGSLPPEYWSHLQLTLDHYEEQWRRNS